MYAVSDRVIQNRHYTTQRVILFDVFLGEVSRDFPPLLGVIFPE